MNWKWMTAAVLGIVVGVAISPFEHKTALASVIPANSHFELQPATVDEPNGEDQSVPTHEVFLLDTQSGKVWKFQGLEWARDKDGTSKVFNAPEFYSVPVVEPGK